MYWIVYALILSAIILVEIKTDRPILILLAYFFGSSCALIGLVVLPDVYIYDGEAVHQQFAPMPWVKQSLGGAELRPRLDSAYLVNLSGEPLVVGEVLYTGRAELVGTPVQGRPVRKDTVSDVVLSFRKNCLAVFEEAPLTLEVHSLFRTESISVVAPLGMALESLNETRYRHLEEREGEDTGYGIIY